MFCKVGIHVSSIEVDDGDVHLFICVIAAVVVSMIEKVIIRVNNIFHVPWVVISLFKHFKFRIDKCGPIDAFSCSWCRCYRVVILLYINVVCDDDLWNVSSPCMSLITSTLISCGVPFSLMNTLHFDVQVDCVVCVGFFSGYMFSFQCLHSILLSARSGTRLILLGFFLVSAEPLCGS